MALLTGSEIVLEYAIAEKVPYVVGLIGHCILPFTDAIYDRQDRIKHIMVKHEHVAVCLADGYFRATGKPLLVYVQSGPGAINAINGVATAFMDSTAMILITGNVWQHHFGKNAIQETSRYFDADQNSAFRPFVKRSWQAQRASNLPEIMHKAFKTALTGRPGPVHIDLPLTVQADKAEVEIPDPEKHRVSSKIRGDIDQIRKAANLLLKAQRPALVCGFGAKFSGASAKVLELAELLAAPVACGHGGKGVIPEDHPLALGTCGAWSAPYVDRILSKSDVVLAVGVKFTEPDTRGWQKTLPFNIPPTKLIHVDIDPEEIARNYDTEIGIWGDAECVISEMLNMVKEERKAGKFLASHWVQEIQEERNRWVTLNAGKRDSSAVPIRPERLIKELREGIPRDGVIFVDTGKEKNWFFQQYPAYGPDTFYIGITWTPMGHSPAAALGVKLADRKKPVVATLGDGSFQMVPWCLSTAVDYNIPITIVVLNDYAYGALRDIQKMSYKERYISVDMRIDETDELFNPDFVKIAEGYGAKGERIEKPEDLRPALNRALNSGKPYVLDVVIDRDADFTYACWPPQK
jgi:acetolactate synthase-1/2/3 large subunit